VSHTFTPGPWTAILDKRKSQTPMALVTTGADHLAIDCRKSGTNYTEDCANARLVAAAPDLLVALKTLLEEEVRDDDDPILIAAHKTARAAIAKAEGK